MKAIYIFILSFIFLLFNSCSKEFINTCDSKGLAFVKPVASFSSLKVGATLTFTNNSQNAENYLWEFGDGTTSTEKNPTKTYPQDKAYIIKLTVKRCEELTASTSETIDMKCDASTPNLSVPASTTICQGETVQLSASCSNGTVIWSNGSTLPSQTISSNGSYYVQCTKNGCFGTKSTTYNFEVKAKPATPTVSLSNASICKGESVTLNTSCNTGNPVWSNGKTSNSITENPATTSAYTVKCDLSGCSSSNSISSTVIVNPLASVKSVAASGTSISKLNITIKGEVTYNTTDGRGEVEDHGFIYKEGTTDPQNDKTAILAKLGVKKESAGKAFSYEIPNSALKKYTYRAYIKACDGKTYYGSLMNN